MPKTTIIARIPYTGANYYLLGRCRAALWKKYAGKFGPHAQDIQVATAAMHALLQLLESGGDIDFDRTPGSY